MHDKFKELTEKYPDLGNAIIFSKLVNGRKMTRNEISKWFLELVPHQDWVGTPKEQLVEFYFEHSQIGKSTNGLK